MAWPTETKQARGYGASWDKLRAATMIRDTYLCVPCKKAGFVTPATQVDHIVPKAKGGTDDLINLQAICGACHKTKNIIDLGGKPSMRINAGIRADGLPSDW